MTLGDLVTLTEMNNGLTVPSRVRDLVAVMQNENDFHVVNVGDSTRQWSAVSTAIAATDNKDSLDLFIQLDGLKFLDMWLKDSQKFSNNTSDSSVGELITLLLRALEKLPVDYEKLVASGIWTTIKDLLVHNNSKVQDKARELYQSWEKKTDGDAFLSNVEKIGPSSDHEVGRTDDTERGSEHSEGGASVQVKGQESTGDYPILAVSSDAEAAQSMAKSLEPPNGHERPLDHVDSHSSATPAMKTLVFNSTVGTTVDTFSPAVSVQDAPHAVSPSDIKHTSKVGNSIEKVVFLEESKASQEKLVTSCSDIADALNPEIKSSSQLYSSNVDRRSWEGGPLHDNSWATDLERKSIVDDSGYVNQSRRSNVFSANAAGEFKHHMMHISSSSEKCLKNPMDIGSSLSGTDGVGKINHNLQMGDSDFTNNFNFAKTKMDRGSRHGGKKSDIELDYGIIDPLEVARQVAIEVEREVGDYKEQSGSSSDKASGNTRQPDSPDTMNVKQSSASEGSDKDMENDPESWGEKALPMQEDSATSTETLNTDHTNVTPDVESSQVTEAAQAEAEKEVSNFDLNLEICSEDNDHPANHFLAPITIVAASKAIAAPGQPAGPLKFEGNLGWKGSAATSAFRPASPRRMLENEKDLSAGESSSSSKQRQVCLEFDLNVTESVDGESCVATNSRNYHLELDLNHASKDTGPSEWRIGHQFSPQVNGHQSRSHSSSLSSKPPFLRNIDLNGQPSFLNDSSGRSYLTKLSQNENVSGCVKSDDSVISIMGTRIQVNRKDFVSQTQPLVNGQTPELAFDLNLGKSGNILGVGSVVPYTHSPLYGYKNIASEPGHAMPFTPNIYGSGGPIPYMVDFRGAPVIPQLVGSVSGLPTAFAQPPFVINMSGSSPSNGAGPSRSSFDHNSGMMSESGSGEPFGFRQFLSTGHVRPVDELQLRSNAQPPVSLVGKRKEPDNGWQQYPFTNYAPPWK